MLLLDGAAVRALLSMGEAIEAVEGAFRTLSEGGAQMPPKLYLDFPVYQGDLRVMPAAMGDEYAGVKIVNSHPGNPERGLPAVAAAYLLSSQETGMPLAFMDGTYLTAVRTGAASAVATRYMAREDRATLGLVGAGVQARFQLEAMLAVRRISEVLVWAPEFDRERCERFVAEAGESFGLPVWAVTEIAEAAGCDLVCTTTPSRSPVVAADAIRPGAHINAVGSDGPGKQELAPAILRKARVVVDEWEQARHGGEINVPLSSGDLTEADVAGSLSEVIVGKIVGRTSPDEVTVFDSTGVAIEDLAVAALVYEKALSSGAGAQIEL